MNSPQSDQPTPTMSNMVFNNPGQMRASNTQSVTDSEEFSPQNEKYVVA
jgi:hypothetical protein